jgi:hypothetical protein
MVAVVFLAGMLAMGAARLGHAAATKARAETAADAAALAAADTIASGRSASAAVGAARDAAAENGARLESCSCERRRASVVVRLEGATARAAAEIDETCRYRPDRC